MRNIILPADLAPNQRYKVRQLLKALRPYDQWEEWVKSDYCFLSPLEIKLVEGYFVCFNIKDLSKRVGINTSRISHDLNAVVDKLDSWEHYYRQWQADRLLIQAGIDAAPTKRAMFLHRPLFAHGMPSRLYYILRRFGQTFYEVLTNRPMKQLQQLEGMGAISWQRLVVLFQQNGCADLLH